MTAMYRSMTLLAVASLLLTALGCAPQARYTLVETPGLRVGVSPDAPPVAFRQGEQLAGIEIDLARQLGRALGREIRFVETQWTDLIPALLDGRIDVIMSGMTITPARQFRIAFADPYFQTGLVALVRRGDESKYASVEDLRRTTQRVGVAAGTRAERWMQDTMSSADRTVFRTTSDAVWELRQRRIDVYINDAPQIAWLVSENEGVLAMTKKPFTNDALAWAFRREDDALRSAANAVLARWRRDGTLDTTLRRWLPGWPGLE